MKVQYKKGNIEFFPETDRDLIEIAHTCNLQVKEEEPGIVITFALQVRVEYDCCARLSKFTILKK